MKQKRLIYLCGFLCTLLPVVAAAQRSQLSFTLETKEKVVELFQPLVIRVVLRNNSSSPISIDTKSLRLIADNWHVVSTRGEWMPGEGERLEPEDRAGGKIELAPGASLRLSAVHENPTFELLGPVRVGYILSSTDNATKKLLPARPRELRFDVPPTRLIATVWAAGSQTQREMAQPAFNEFLKLRAAAEAAADSEGGDFHKRLANQAFATKSLYYLAGYALPFLRDAVRDKDPFIREQAVLAYPHAAGAIDQLDAYLTDLEKLGPRPQWALDLKKGHNKDQDDWRGFALRALGDATPNVRVAAITVLKKKYWSEDNFFSTAIGYPENNREKQSANSEETLRDFNAIKALSKDPDANVRAAVQKYLAGFADENAAADTVAEALTDPDSTVRKNALDALLRSPEAPPLDTIKRAFLLSKGDTALGLIPLLLEQEDSTLSTTLGNDFARRSELERLAIMTAIAGHTDNATLDLIKSGLSDSSSVIQRAALMRLLPLPRDASMPVIQNYLSRAPAELKPVAEAVKSEIETRARWGFLKTASNDQASASESIFPSRNGGTPITSPDGQWIAYVETGWGRPGGSGGFGRSNLISIAHVVGANGQNDRVVSDMFLASWMADSKRVGTARDAFAAISDFDGNVVSEFGTLHSEGYRGSSNPGADWTKLDLRSQFGGRMPHQKRLDGTEDFGFGEGGAFSPDGRFYGPLRDVKGAFFLGVDGQRLPLKVELSQRFWGATWSPDGRYVQVRNDRDWLIIDMQSLSSHQIARVDDYYFPGGQCNRNPWSRDGRRLVFVRDGQVWVSDAYGNSAKQITFDSTRKTSPTFSRNGRSVAYLTWQADNRRHYERVGPTDLWIVDVSSTLATRVTAFAPGRINSFDWIDDFTLIIDRFEPKDDSLVSRSSLRRISLATSPSKN